MKLNSFREILEKYPNHENRPLGRVVPCGYTDGQTDTTKIRRLKTGHIGTVVTLFIYIR